MTGPIVLPGAQTWAKVMTGPILPLAGAQTWAKVMEQAGHRCQCTRCPRHRRDSGGRCETTTAVARLTAGSADPEPNPARTLTTDTGDLVAWCGPCWDRTVTRGRKATRDAARMGLLGPTTDPLF